jgi:competence protein ComEC
MAAGDGAGNARVFAPWWLTAAVALAATLLFLSRRQAIGMTLALIAIAAAATLPVQQLIERPLSKISVSRFADGSTVALEGYLERAPERVERERALIELYLRVERAGAIATQMTPAADLVRITASIDRPFQVGDELRVSGRIRFPRNNGNPGEFDYRDWLLRQGIAATMFVEPKKGLPAPIVMIGHRDFWFAAHIERIREEIGAFIDANLKYPENVEMRALIIGDRGGIDENLRQRFALTGMAHLLVISGLHLGFVAAAAFFLGRWLMGFFPSLTAFGYGNKVAALCAGVAVSGYAAIAGYHVSTVRALIMVLSYALAILLDRSRELISSLALAALIICLVIPGSTADIGFQLSFASVLVILLGMRRFSAWWRWRYENPLAPRRERLGWARIAEIVAGYVAVSFWALMGTAPLTAFHFNQFSMVGIVANAVVAPIMGFGSVICGLIAASLSFVAMTPARGFLWIAGKLAVLGTSLAGWFAGWPLAWERIFTPTIIELVIVYGLLLLWLVAPLKGESVRRLLQMSGSRADENNLGARHSRWRTMAAGVLFAALLVDAGWWVARRDFNRDLKVTFLAVGEGDAAVVRFPGSRVMLIDGGGAFRGTFDPGERIVAPFLWSQKIMHVDYVALSHPDRDHFGGLIFIARNFSPSEFWTSGTESDDESYASLVDAMRRAGARFKICNSALGTMKIGAVEMRCVGPLANTPELKENNSSMVIRMGYGLTRILFAGDLEAKGEHELIASGADLRARILKVPHHGSRTSSSAAFVAAVRPEVAVISLGYQNRFHFPAAEVVQRYREEGTELLRTDEDGAIGVEAGTNGFAAWSFRRGAAIGGRYLP